MKIILLNNFFLKQKHTHGSFVSPFLSIYLSFLSFNFFVRICSSLAAVKNSKTPFIDQNLN